MKEVILKYLDLPKDLKKIDPATDRFYQLIRNTPNVKDVFSHTSFGTKEWEYFTFALLGNTNWRLESLPVVFKELTHFSLYFNCAFHVRNTLTELTLRRGMIGRQDWDRLAEFKQLKDLTVGEHVLKDLYDCHNLLRYLPPLEHLEIKGFQMGSGLEDQDSARRQIAINKNNIGIYHSVKRLHIASYCPSNDEALRYIMDNYTGLDQFSLTGMSGNVWPMPTISKSVMISLNKFVQRCNSYWSTTIDDFSGEAWLLKMFYDSQKKVMERGGRTDFSLGLLEQGRPSRETENFN